MRSFKTFCLFISFFSVFITANSQTSSGDLETYLNIFIDNVPGSSGDNFSIPTATDLINWESAVRDILLDDIASARVTAALFNYIITEYTDTNHLPGQVYYILEEDAPLSKHWGSYVFNSSPVRDNLILQTTHARYDTNTGDEAVYSFTRLSAKAIFIQGTHRCNHNATTSCDGTTSACDSTSKPFSISDVAHNVSTVYQKTTEIVAEDLNIIFVQLHGFSQQASDPDIIMSNGTTQTPSGTDYVVSMRDELLNVDASLTFKIPHIDIGWTRLIATTNTQGRHLNQSASPCNTEATSSTGRFVHIEQAFSLRSNSTGWDKIYVALSNVFSNGCLTDTTPPVIDCQDLTVQLNSSGNGSLTQTVLDNLATEDCSTATVTASKTSFVCADVLHSPNNKMVITGVVEGDFGATNVKAVEVTVLQDIQDLSLYGLGAANNGGGTDGEEFTFSASSAVAGEKFLITDDNTLFNTFFGYSADFVESVTGAIYFNGDDAIELFYNGSVIDSYGEPNVDGTGEAWEYTNGWAYRVTDTHPDGTVFVSDHWTFSGVNANTGANNNSEASPQFPIESYQILPNSQTVIIEATDDSGNTSNCVVNVQTEPFETVYSGGSWSNGEPTNVLKAKFSENYNTTSNSIDACTCEVEAGNTVTVSPGGYMSIEGNILIDGVLIIDHEGSVVQVNDNALVINNGIINVIKTTPVATGNSFSILGSPMSGTARDGAFLDNNVVMNHDTSLFNLDPVVTAVNSGAEHFADAEGDNWSFMNGSAVINPSEGYLVGPTTASVGTGFYDLTYTQGTLNNGVYNYNALYNGSQEESANILSNPYASAIDAIQFISDNAIVDAVYFWEHLTAPTSAYPGYRSENWDMGDISIHNGTGGTAAPNGGTIPTQYIPSGQGFAIKANAAGTVTFNNSMRVTGNNDGYRRGLPAIDKLYLTIENATYHLQSSALIGFTEQATNNYDAIYDTKRLATPISIYSIVDERELAIQGRSVFNENHIIPLGFRTMVEEVQIYTISLSSIEGVLISNATAFLQDNLLNTVTNLSEGDYTFTSNESNQKDRFVLVFTEDLLGNNEVSIEEIAIYPNPTSGLLNIVSPLAPITSIEVYDVRGRKMLAKAIDQQGNYQLDMSQLETAMYFVRISTQAGSVTKRIIKH